MATLGREVLRGRLLHKSKGSSWKKRVVIAYCGSTTPKKQHSAQLQLFEDYEKVVKPGQKPKKGIELASAKINNISTGSPNGSQSNSPAYVTTLVNSSPSPSPSPRNSITLSASPNIQSLGTQGTTLHIFQIVTPNETHEFRTESENDRLRWMKLLGLLVMFPHSTIPEEPQSNPIKESFRCKLDPTQYGADSVWAVYILPEEVGTRCTIIGMNVLTLRSGVPNRTVGKLSIINPADPSNPLVSWERDKMRRTGKTGNLVFIEIGRRCQGGPGLVWMYAGLEEAQALRETLHNFLFHGDGKAVAIPAQQTNPIYDIPRASYDSSLPPSYQRQGSISSGYQHHKLNRMDSSQDPGSGVSPTDSSEPPPVRLDKHPSIRKKRSAPCDMPGRNGSRHSHSSSPGGSVDRDTSIPSMQSTESLINEETLFQQEESSSPLRRSLSPEESSCADSESIMGNMDPDLDMSMMTHTRCFTEPALATQQPVSMASRAHSTASCEPSRRGEYEKMTHPHAALYNKGGYIYMKPTESGQKESHYANPRSGGQQESHYANPRSGGQQETHYANPRAVPLPFAHLQQHMHQSAQSDDMYQHLQHFPSRAPNPSAVVDMSRKNVQAYDRLPPIKEAQIAERNRTTSVEAPPAASRVPMPSEGGRRSSENSETPSAYENHPLPAHLQNVSQVIYKPSYENVNLAHAERKGSQNQEPYENVTPTGEQIPAEPRTRPNGLVKRASLRKGRSADKEDVVLPLKGNGLSINGKEIKSPSPPLNGFNRYIEVESTRLGGNQHNATIRPVAYTTIDFPSTNEFQNIQRERAELKASVES